MAAQAMVPGDGYVFNPGVSQAAAPGFGYVFQSSTGTTFTFNVSGGITLSGAPAIIRERIFPVSGSVVFAGTAPFSTTATYTFTVLGGFVLSGTLAVVKIRSLSVGGQVVFGGGANYQFIPFGVVADFYGAHRLDHKLRS